MGDQPLWWHKAAIEKFVHSYGLELATRFRTEANRGLWRDVPIAKSKWYDLIAAVVRGETIQCSRGGKEVHAADVARAVAVLLTAEEIAGEAFNCYDRYISELDVASARQEADAVAAVELLVSPCNRNTRSGPTSCDH